MKCTQCKSQFEIIPDDKAFYNKVSPIIAGKKYQIPEPTLCPDCRMQRRMAWRNERKLYRRKCDLTGDSIISWIAPDKPHKVYKKDAWWSDKWDAHNFGRDFDFNRPFFDQLNDLIKEAPWLDLLYDKSINSEYVNFCNNNKDCYLIFATNDSENCYYCSAMWGCKDTVECFQAFNCELCYGCLDVSSCYNCKYCKNCDNSSECIFCENCRGCKNCFGCVNLVGKEYYFMNEQLSKEDYETRIRNLKLDSYERVQEAREFFNKHRLKFPMRFAQVVNCENCTGDVIRNCKNSKETFDTNGAEDCKFVMLSDKPTKDCYDSHGLQGSELIYETVVAGVPATNITFSSYIWINAHNVQYSILCPGAQNCFGCVGLHKGKYCILNKQYSKEEYEKLVPKIIEHMQSTKEWGEFFPINLSPFDYNETIAQDYFPLTEDEVKKHGWRWRKKEKKEYQPSNYQIPDSLKDVSADICGKILGCKECSRNYKVIPKELQFYKNHNIPIPQTCSDCRIKILLNMRNPKRLWERECDKCASEIKTTYSPDRPEKVYCEECYLSDVY